MTPIKEYIATQLLYKKFHFKCDCLIPLDTIGYVNDYEISGNEIILIVNSNGKILHIGLNTPSLVVQEL